MIVAGSVLAMLLMGFAVEGFVNPVDEDDDTDAEGEGDNTDQSGVATTALSDLLFAADDGDSAEFDDYPSSAQPAAMAFGYTPLDQIELEDEDDADGATADDFLFGDDMFNDDAFEHDAEAKADSDWAEIAAGPAAAAFMDVEDLTVLEDGSEVSLVADFSTTTDELVLEFDGSAEQAPDITVDLETEEGSGLVLANGIPVTLIEGATDLTAEHVRVVMNGDEIAESPGVSPNAAEFVELPGSENTSPDPAVTPADDLKDNTSLPQDLTQFLDAPTAELSENAGTAVGLGAQGEDESIFSAADGDAGHDSFDGDFMQDADSNDVLEHGSDPDLLFGDDGDDVLLGGAVADFPQGIMSADMIDGEYVENAEVAGHVADFDPSEDRIEVIFDPDVNPNPQVEVQDFEDGSGADILLNGSVILSVSGAQGMDPDLIDLREVA